MTFDFKKAYKEFYAPSTTPSIITIPPMNFIALAGKGDPNEVDGEYSETLGALYSVAYTLRMSEKNNYAIDGFFTYTVPPLEGFWWQDGVHGMDYRRKDELNFISLIRLPDFISEKDFAWAIETATKKKKQDLSHVKFLAYDEGLCVQCMHIGPYDNEPATVALMDQLCEQEGYTLDINESRFHHEIYLSDPRKTAPDKLRTIIRHPIKKR